MIMLTESAAEKILDLFKEQETEGAALRVFVKGDDNGQPAYGMAIEPDPSDADEVIESFGVKVVVDEESLPWVIGSEIDFIDSLERTGFTIRNPNMGGGACACGGGGGGACGCGGHGAGGGACACGGAGAGACACGHEEHAEETAGATQAH
ncbi:MAG: iron-sulfur cluster assembly accessory protein [Dehalococcoidia bacterium]|nr:iron-sulfur cluster assembly accessory protein [Dehalococcoidia bacterium]